MFKMSEITVLRGLSDAVVMDSARAPNASPITKPRVLPARVVTDGTFGWRRKSSGQWSVLIDLAFFRNGKSLAPGVL